MVYRDPASNSESKPQSLRNQNLQKFHLEKQQNFLEIFDQKPYSQQKLSLFNCFVVILFSISNFYSF
jgi:hypothetical protein